MDKVNEFFDDFVNEAKLYFPKFNNLRVGSKLYIAALYYKVTTEPFGEKEVHEKIDKLLSKHYEKDIKNNIDYICSEENLDLSNIIRIVELDPMIYKYTYLISTFNMKRPPTFVSKIKLDSGKETISDLFPFDYNEVSVGSSELANVIETGFTKDIAVFNTANFLKKQESKLLSIYQDKKILSNFDKHVLKKTNNKVATEYAKQKLLRGYKFFYEVLKEINPKFAEEVKHLNDLGDFEFFR